MSAREKIGLVYRSRYGGWYVEISDVLATAGACTEGSEGEDRVTAASSLANARRAARDLAAEFEMVRADTVRLERTGRADSTWFDVTAHLDLGGDDDD